MNLALPSRQYKLGYVILCTSLLPLAEVRVSKECVGSVWGVWQCGVQLATFRADWHCLLVFKLYILCGLLNHGHVMLFTGAFVY